MQTGKSATLFAKPPSECGRQLRTARHGEGMAQCGFSAAVLGAVAAAACRTSADFGFMAADSGFRTANSGFTAADSSFVAAEPLAKPSIQSPNWRL
jgi:hypothetical protein